MLDAGEFQNQDLDIAKDNIIDALWCQSDAEMAGNNGTWYRPPGANNLVSNVMSAPPALWVMHYDGQVGLYRDGAITNHEGLYRCVITDAVMTEHTFYVGIYRTATYKNFSKC